jgi:RNA polymerase sigma factor (sigma-70 family)
LTTDPASFREYPNATTQIRRAQDGDRDSLSWIFDYFTPLLELHAAMKIGVHLQKTVDPRDLISDAWLIVIPRLSEIEPRNGHLAPVLMKFLATTITNRATNLLRRSCRRDVPMQVDGTNNDSRVPVESDVVNKLLRSERELEMRRVIGRLSDGEKQLLAHRIIEDQPINLVAVRFGESPNTVSQRCRRLLIRLREMLPDNIFDEWELDS